MARACRLIRLRQTGRGLGSVARPFWSGSDGDGGVRHSGFRPTGKSSERSSWRLLDHKSDSAGALAARHESRDRQAPLWPEVGAGVAREFMPKRNSGPIRRRGPMGNDAALSRLAKGRSGDRRIGGSCFDGGGCPVPRPGSIAVFV